jgi:hypothetical protein
MDDAGCAVGVSPAGDACGFDQAELRLMTMRLARIVASEITRIEERMQSGSLPEDDVRRLPELARAVEHIMKQKANAVGRKRSARVDRETKSNDGPVQTDDIVRIRAEVERRIDRLAESGGLAGNLRESDGDGTSIRP